MMSVKF